MSQAIQLVESVRESGVRGTTPENAERIRAILPTGITTAELLVKEFPDAIWVVPGLIPAGCTILAGAPKTGKSWFALCLGIALSTGGAVLGSQRVDRQPVVYLALEDTERRLQQRLRDLEAEPSDDFHVYTEWKNGSKGLDHLALLLQIHPEVKVIIIDTLQRFRGFNGQNTYESDYDEVGKLKRFADEAEVSIVALHHTRKMESADPLMMVSGTLGITGAADTTAVLKRSRREAKAELFVTGRDVEDQELALEFTNGIGWSLLGDADAYRQTNERRAVLDALEESTEPMSGKDIALVSGMKYDNVRYLLSKLKQEGFVDTVKRGLYVPT